MEAIARKVNACRNAVYKRIREAGFSLQISTAKERAKVLDPYRPPTISWLDSYGVNLTFELFALIAIPLLIDCKSNPPPPRTAIFKNFYCTIFCTVQIFS